MELTHRFTVPVGIETAWDTFADIATVATCFPGAAVTEAEGDSFSGTVKVKLGPVALQYAGSGTFVERDADAHRMVVNAKGRDKRGNGTAGANVTATFVAEGDSTRVEVVTDLQITGKPAQFGRGVMQDVSDKLLAQFVDCLRARIGQQAPSDTASSGDDEVSSDPVVGAPAAESADPSASVDAPTPADAPAPAGRPAPVPRPAPDAQGEDALDLGATVLPVLAKAYWRQAVGALVVVLIALRWRRGRR